MTSGTDLADSIASAEAKAPELTSDIEEAEAQKTQLDEDVAKAKTDREAAKASMADATAIREKEAAAFASEHDDLTTNIAAIKKAVAALEAGAYAAFVQTDAGAVLRKVLTANMKLIDSESPELLSFLSGTQGAGYAPQSGEVIGILKQLGDKMSAALGEAGAAEAKAVQEYDALMASKKKEIAALTAAIESKMERSAELGISIVHMKDDLSDTERSLLEDKKFLSDLSSNCANKTAEWDAITKTRNDEVVALAETIKILNDDDALELFKKTLPSSSSSLLQSADVSAKMRTLKVLRSAAKSNGHDSVRMNFISLALAGKQVGFQKVIEMIDEMVDVLKKEQSDDDIKKEYCKKEADTTEDKMKGLERSIADVETAISATEEGLAAVAEELAALEQSIAELNKSTAEATEVRQAEHEAFIAMMQETTSAKELLGMATNRLHEFYNPSLHVTTPAPKLSREDQIYNAFEGADFAQVAMVKKRNNIRAAGAALIADAPPAAPEAPGPYEKKMEENTGVLAMIDLLIKDLDTQMTEAQSDEKHGQEAYQELMSDSASMQDTNSKSLTEKKLAKADMSHELVSHGESKASTMKELKATSEYLAQLHADCDWLLKYYETRKEARASEIGSLGDAKAVLSGADYSMLQVRRRGNLRLPFGQLAA